MHYDLFGSDYVYPVSDHDPGKLVYGYCPPEDSGGSPGYIHLSEILAEPGKDPEEYEDIQEWLGEQFDLDEVCDRAFSGYR